MMNPEAISTTPVTVPTGRINRYYNNKPCQMHQPPQSRPYCSGNSMVHHHSPSAGVAAAAMTPLTCQVTPPSTVATNGSSGRVTVQRVVRARTVSLSDSSPPAIAGGQLMSPTGAVPAACKQHKRHSLFSNLKVLVGRTRSTSTSVSSSGYGSGFTGDTIDEDVEAGAHYPRDGLLACQQQAGAPHLRKRRVAGTAEPLDADALATMGEHMEVDDEGIDDDDCMWTGAGARRHTCGNAELMLLRRNSGPHIEFLGTIDCQHNPYSQFLRATTCYDVAPHHGRLVALDWTLPIYRALYYVLTSDPTECRGIVWSGKSYAGPVTLTDLLTVLHLGGADALLTRDLKWMIEQRAQLCRIQPKDMASAVTDMSLFDAVEIMFYNRLHRLPVFEDDDQKSLLYWVGTRRIMQSFNRLVFSGTVRKWLTASVERARIGTWTDLNYVLMSTTVEEALGTMLDQHLSLLPVLENRDNRKLLDTLSKRDVAHALGWHIADNGGIMHFRDYAGFLQKTVGYVLERPGVQHKLETCVVRPADTLTHVIHKMSIGTERAVFVADDNEELIAAISSGELIRYIMEERQPEPCLASPSQRGSVSTTCSMSPSDRKLSTRSAVAEASTFSRSLDHQALERMSSAAM